MAWNPRKEPSPRPQSTLALGACGPQHGFHGAERSVKTCHQKDSVVRATERGADSMSAGPSLDFPSKWGQRCKASQSLVSVSLMSIILGLRFLRAPLPQRPQAMGCAPCCNPGAQHGPGMRRALAPRTRLSRTGTRWSKHPRPGSQGHPLLGTSPAPSQGSVPPHTGGWWCPHGITSVGKHCVWT